MTGLAAQRLQGRLAVVTGGSSGIGEQIAARFAGEGARVVNLDLEEGKTAEGVEFRRCDVTRQDQVDAVAGELTAGASHPEILVNSVGIYPTYRLDEMDLDLWRKVMSINAESMFLMCRAFAPTMISAGYGRIINIASNSFYGATPLGYSLYTATKGAMIGFTRGLATDLGEHGVTVNAIAPGLLKHEKMLTERDESLFEEVAAQQAIHRSQLPEDVAGAAAFLASDDAAFMTGQTVVVDGGLVRV